MFKLTARNLTRAEQEAIIEDKLRWILSVCKPLKVILFGSAARFQMKESSDIDLILIFPDSTNLRMVQQKINISRHNGDWPQDLLFYTCETFAASLATGGGAAWLAAKEGLVLFSQTEGVS